jgi:guanylate kinase
MKPGLLYVITAPSGCGKGTLRRALLAQQPDIKFCPSVTTRPQRPGEIDGVDYIFVSVEEFMERKQRDQFVEWAEVYGNYYGTPREDLEQALEQGHVVLLEKDVQGARTLRQAYPDGIFIFILPPSFEELQRRIRTRGTENDMEQRVRLDSARREIADLAGFDYVIINEDIERATDRLVAISLGERARRGLIAGKVQRGARDGKLISERCDNEDRFQVHSGAGSGQAGETACSRAARRCAGRRETSGDCHRRDMQR